MAQDLSDYNRLTGYPELLHLYGVGDHGGGPTRSMLETATRWEQKDLVYPKLEVGAAQPFFDKLFQAAPKLTLPTWKSELYLEYHRGTYTSQSETKRNNRRNEELLLNAEKFSSLAGLYGAEYPAKDLNDSWKKVLFNQFHDILSGSSVAAVYRDADRDHAEVRRIAGHDLQSALGQIEARVKTSGPGVPVIVFNPLAWERTSPVEFEASFPSAVNDVEVHDDTGRVIPAQLLQRNRELRRVKVLFMAEGLPALGYRVFHLVPTTRARATAADTGPQIENEFLRVRIDPKSGCMSLFDKKNQREAFEAGKCGNLLQAFYDLPHEYDAWNIDANFEDKNWDIDKAEEVKVTERGPVRSTIHVVRKFQNSTFAQDIHLYPGIAQVVVETDADWNEKHILIKAAFPMPVRNENATYEIPYGSIGRPTTRRNAFEKARFEVPALRWADLSDDKYGVSIINESKYGYDGKDNVLRLSLLRSPAYPDPHADEGKHHFSYAIYPHAGGWQAANTVRHGYEFNYAPIVFQATAHDGTLPASQSFVKIEPADLVLTAMKQTESGDGLLLRFYESSGQAGRARIQIPPGATAAFDANLMEKQQEPIQCSGREINVPFGAWEIKTILLHYPKAKTSLTAASE
jgi:alpha-mannosidase